MGNSVSLGLAGRALVEKCDADQGQQKGQKERDQAEDNHPKVFMFRLRISPLFQLKSPVDRALVEAGFEYGAYQQYENHRPKRVACEPKKNRAEHGYTERSVEPLPPLMEFIAWSDHC